MRDYSKERIKIIKTILGKNGISLDEIVAVDLKNMMIGMRSKGRIVFEDCPSGIGRRSLEIMLKELTHMKERGRMGYDDLVYDKEEAQEAAYERLFRVLGIAANINQDIEKLKKKLTPILLQLNDDELRLLDARYGLSDGIPKTLKAVAEVFGVTRERIRFRENRVLRKLQKIIQEEVGS